MTIKNVPVLHQLIVLIEEILKADAPVAAKAAETAALATAQSDPKVQAITAGATALLAAAQSLKAVINTPATTPTSQK